MPALQGVDGCECRWKPSLEAVAGLHESLNRVAELDTQLASVAALKGSMDQLGGAQPILIIGLVASGGVGLVTFVAVSFAIVSAASVTRTSSDRSAKQESDAVDLSIARRYFGAVVRMSGVCSSAARPTFLS